MARRLDDGRGRYIEFCKASFPRRRTLSDLKIVIDCANGAAYATAPEVLWELGAEVVRLGVSPNGENINKDCGSTDPAACQQAVLDNGGYSWPSGVYVDSPEHGLHKIMLAMETRLDRDGVTWSMPQGSDEELAALRAELARYRTWVPPGDPYSPIPDLAEIEADMGAFWRSLAGDSQLTIDFEIALK